MVRRLPLLLPLVPVVFLATASRYTPLFAPGQANPDARVDDLLGRHLEYIRLESAALAGNLIGDPNVREYATLLPPSYFAEPGRRFPVVYLLHGMGKRQNGHLDTIWVMRAAFDEMKAGRLGQMILVAVDGTTSLGGSYYSNSPAIGNFQTYIVQEIVGDVDRRYRTIANAEARGIAGFSMGGHGALKLAMKHRDVFSGAGSLSGSPLSFRYSKEMYQLALAQHVRPSSLEELKARISFQKDWPVAAAYAKAAAFSPNPKHPPLFLDLPFDGSMPNAEDPVWKHWVEDDPLSLVPRYQQALRSMRLLYLDHGDQEKGLGTEDFDRALVQYDLDHVHHTFAGGHNDDLAGRHLRMLRHFAISWGQE